MNTTERQERNRSRPGSRDAAARALAAACLAAGLACLPGCDNRAAVLAPTAGSPADAPPVLPAGAFRITAQQAANLAIRGVERHPFRSEVVTEGRIALDTDLQTSVYSPYGGRVLRVLASPGDRVKAGQPLLDLEASEFVQAQGDLQAAAASERSAESQLALARGNEERRHALYDAHVGSLQDWQQAQNDLAVAGNVLQSAQSAVALVRSRLRILGQSPGQIARIEQGQAIDARTQVVAPIGGVVTDRQVGPGQYVQSAAANPLFVIGDLAHVWLVGNVRESQAQQLRRGQDIEVRVPAWPERVFRARLSYIAPTVDPATHRLAVRGEIANADGSLRPEMFASFTIATSPQTQSLAVPVSAVVYEGEHARVWVEASTDVLEARAIRTGRSTHDMVEVLAGLAAGERVVTSGTLFIDRAGHGD